MSPLGKVTSSLNQRKAHGCPIHRGLGMLGAEIKQALECRHRPVTKEQLSTLETLVFGCPVDKTSGKLTEGFSFYPDVL